MKLFFIFLLVFPVCSFADDVFKCKNNDGKIIYSLSRCADKSAQINILSIKGFGKDDSVSGVLKVTRESGLFYVEGSVNNGKSTNFIIDTGASIVGIPTYLVTNSGYKCQKYIRISTPSGNSDACLTKLSNLKFGNFSVYDVDAVILPNAESPIIGMNVLKEFNVRIEKDNLVIEK